MTSVTSMLSCNCDSSITITIYLSRILLLQVPSKLSTSALHHLSLRVKVRIAQVSYLSSNGSSTGKSTKTPAATGGSDSDEVDSDDSDNLPVVHYHKIAKKLDTSSESSSWDSI